MPCLLYLIKRKTWKSFSLFYYERAFQGIFEVHNADFQYRIMVQSVSVIWLLFLKVSIKTSLSDKPFSKWGSINAGLS